MGGNRRADRPAGADLHDHPHSPLGQRPGALPVRGRLAQVSKSERRFNHLFGPCQPASDAAHQRDGRWPGRNSRECRIDIVCRGNGLRRLPRHRQTEPFFEDQYVPAACAAASSPRPNPTTALGRTPTLDHSAVSAH